MTAALRERDPALRDLVADEVRAWLGRRRMSGAQLARALGKSQSFVARRLDGRQAMDLDDLQMIANVLRVPVTVLFQGAATNTDTRTPTVQKSAGSADVITLFPQIRRHAAASPARKHGRTRELSGIAS